MKLLTFLRYFFVWLAQNISWCQMMYLVREGIDPRTPSNVRWSAELRSVDKTPENERERLLPLKKHSVILKDLTMLNPEQMIYHTTDTEKVEKVMDKLAADLKRMPCHEFYEKWVVHPNFDFLITERDRLDF
jgi:hypothetical protein